MTQEENVPQKIADYYETEEHLAWDLLTKGHIHLGYWDDNNRDVSFAEGAKRLTQLMIDQTEISIGQRFCDIGCGVGGPAIMLAREKGCIVDGVTISEYQKKEAGKRAVMEGVDDKARFVNADALNLPFSDNTFEGGWFFESIFHMGHHNALCEAHRVLKPGSVLLITDVVDIGLLTEEDKQDAKDICNVDYVTKQEYQGLLKEAGFELVQLSDITEEVIGPFQSKFAEAVRAQKNEVFNILRQDKDILKGFEEVAEKFSKIGYIIVTARNKDS